MAVGRIDTFSAELDFAMPITYSTPPAITSAPPAIVSWICRSSNALAVRLDLTDVVGPRLVGRVVRDDRRCFSCAFRPK